MQTLVIKFRDTSSSVDFDIPSYCPHCGMTMSPRILSTLSDDKRAGNSNIGLFARCTVETCSKYFSLEYELYYGKSNHASYPSFSIPQLIEYTYNPSLKVDLPENIEIVSAAFVEIYSQATVAESEGLDQIAGVGYRKSAEFLIKDYAIRKYPDDEVSIKKKLLGSVIKEYLNEFPRIQQLSTAIAWIGNDETHYVRRHNHKDINDLKRFIKASAQFIAADYDVDEAFEFTSSS